MANSNLHIIKDNDMWKVKREQAGRSSGCFNTQKEAIEYAIPKAKKIT